MLVRSPGFPDRDFMMTTDEPHEAIEMIQRRVGLVLREAAMNRDQFHHAMRILLNIEADELRALGFDTHNVQRFFADPLRFFIVCDDPTCDALWGIVEERINRRSAA